MFIASHFTSFQYIKFMAELKLCHLPDLGDRDRKQPIPCKGLAEWWRENKLRLE